MQWIGLSYQTWLAEVANKLLPKELAKQVYQGDIRAEEKAGKFLQENGFCIQAIMNDKRAGIHARMVHIVKDSQGALETHVLSEFHMCFSLDKTMTKTENNGTPENIIKLS